MFEHFLEYMECIQIVWSAVFQWETASKIVKTEKEHQIFFFGMGIFFLSLTEARSGVLKHNLKHQKLIILYLSNPSWQYKLSLIWDVW